MFNRSQCFNISEFEPLSTPPGPDPSFLAELARESELLESAIPEQILQWAVDRFAPKFAMATAFGPEGMVLIHMLAKIAPKTAIFNLETGYQFAETMELREQVLRRYGIEVELKRPSLSVEEYERINGGPVYTHDPSRCCADRKISILKQAASNYDAWASAIAETKVPIGQGAIVGWDKKFGLVKVSLANWTKKQVWAMITKEDIPYNPLHDQGYTSIGCWPCTRSILPEKTRGLADGAALRKLNVACILPIELVRKHESLGVTIHDTQLLPPQIWRFDVFRQKVKRAKLVLGRVQRFNPITVVNGYA